MINHTLVALMLAIFSSQGECATSFDTQSNQLEFEPIELAPMTISQHTTTNKSTPTAIKPGRSPRKQIPSSPAASATNSGLVEPTTYEVNDSRYKRLWGPGLFIIDALADINIGTVKGVQYLVSHRFRSPYSGKITAARPYWTGGSGYAAGNGGKIGVRIMPDDGTSNHLPNLAASPIATGIYEPGMLFGRHVLSSFKDSVSLAALEQVVAGKLYHLVYENLASNPAADYLGVNHVVTVEKNGRPARWLGVDDWALCKRDTYGTVPVDLERHRPVALLPGREADMLAGWLREHPGVEVISRDRSGAFSKGARHGAPGAVQVADRFHLLQNLAEALELVFSTHATDLHAAEQARRDAVLAEHGTVAIAPSEPQAKAKLLAAGHRERRLAQHGQVWALYRQGWSGEKIGPHLGISRTTVYLYLRSEVFPERKGRSDAGHSRLDQWRHVVLEHWNGDRRNSRKMFQDLQRRGYRGSYPTLAYYLRRLRAAAHVIAASGRPASARPKLNAAPRKVLTPQTITWTVLRRAEKRIVES